MGGGCGGLEARLIWLFPATQGPGLGLSHHCSPLHSVQGLALKSFNKYLLTEDEMA